MLLFEVMRAHTAAVQSIPTRIGEAHASKHASRRDIQGMRALAVLAVIVFHVDSRWLSGGFLGVDIFFVISGYLVTGLILRRRLQGTFSLTEFYRSRLKRIAPAYFAMLTSVTVIAAVFFVSRDFDFYEKSLRAAIYFASNQYFATLDNYFAPRSSELPLLHTWSLAIEMQFYLLLPLFVLAVPKRYWRLAFPALVLVLVSGAGYTGYQTFRQEDYFLLMTRAPEFLIGSCTALVGTLRVGSRAILNSIAFCGLLLVIGGFFVIDGATKYAGLIVLLPCLGAAMLMVTPDSIVSRVLSLRPLERIGDLSYSIYLWHWPVLACMRYYTYRHDLSPLEIAVFAIATSALSWLSYRFVETPLRQPSSVSFDLRAATAVAAIVAAVTVAAPRVNATMATSLQVEQLRFGDPKAMCIGRIVGDCIRGDRSAAREILVIGDSHGGQLNHFFDAVGAQNRFRAYVITTNGCVNIPGFDLEPLTPDTRVACTRQSVAAAKHFESAEYIVVAGLWEYHVDRPAFMLAMDKFLSEMETRGKKVKVIAQIPLLSKKADRAHRFEQLGIPFHLSQTASSEIGNREIKRLLMRHPAVELVDLSKSGFFDNAPFFEGSLTYSDANHLNEIGARRLGELSAAEFP